MASRELYSSIAKPKKKYTFGQKLGDVGLGLADNTLSAIGMGDLISPEAYNSEQFGQFTDKIGGLYEKAGATLMGLATGGVGPTSFAEGGLRTFEGPSHEQGGIQLGADSDFYQQFMEQDSIIDAPEMGGYFRRRK